MLKSETSEKRSEALLDNRAHSRLLLELSEYGASEETMRFIGIDRPIGTGVVLRLDDDFCIRASVTGGSINVSVTDDVVQLQREVWKRSELQRAIGWIIGYAAGYKQ